MRCAIFAMLSVAFMSLAYADAISGNWGMVWAACSGWFAFQAWEERP